MPSTPKTVSSVLLPAQTKSQIPMLLLQQERVQSSPTLLIILMTTQFGGKVLIRILLQTLLNGRAILGTVRKAKKRVHIPTAVSQLPLRTVPVSVPNLKIPTVFLFPLSYSAADVQSLLRLYISQEAGITVYLLVQSWLQKQQQQLQVQ